MDILIKNIDIITMDEPHLFLKNGSIGISGGLIKFVGSAEEHGKDFHADRVIDGKHRIAMPGIVNAHTHCAMTLLRNYANDLALEDWLYNHIFPVEERLECNDVYWGTLLGIAEMIKSGTTTFADMYLHMDAVAQAVVDTGIRANLSRSPLLFRNNGEPKVIDETMDCYEYHRAWHNHSEGRIKVYIEVHSVYLFNEESLKNAANLAKELGTGIHIHMLETARERRESIERYGMDPAEICEKWGIFDVPVIAAHCVHLSRNDMEIFKRKNVNVVHNPTSNLKLGSGIAPVPEMLEKGINISLGTDGAASNNNLNMFEEINLAALIHKGVKMDPVLVDAKEVLRMACPNGAATAGWGGEAGIIREGAKADIILIDTDKPHFCPMQDPFSAVVYSAQGSDVDTVIVDGNILMESGELKTIDEEKAKYMVRKTAEKIFRKNRE